MSESTSDPGGIAVSSRPARATTDPRVVAAEVVVAALLGAVWAGRRLRRTYFYFDEWSMIGRVSQLGPLEGATTSFNGHLWLFQDMIFRVQAKVFGLDSNTFLATTFLVSLVALHLALTALAVRIDVSLLPALLLAGLLTYLGPAAQNFVFAIQVSPTCATAAAVGATAIVLERRSTMRRCAAVAFLLLLSVLFDSGVGLLALALGGGAVVGLWPRHRWWVLAPSVLVTVVWYGFGDLGPEFDASVGDRIAFAARLVVRGAGALVGGGAWSGVAVLVVFASATVLAVTTRQIDRAGWTVMLAAALATTINVAGIAQSRSALEGFTFFENNRYLQNVAIPLTITFLPALVACSRLAMDRWSGGGRRAKQVRQAVPIIALAACFVSGLDEERDYADVFIARTERVHAGVDDIAIVHFTGCPSGTVPDLSARPLAALSPQISVGLVAELVDRGLLTVAGATDAIVAGSGDDYSVEPEILRIICGT